jgi:hypothetical protein
MAAIRPVNFPQHGRGELRLSTLPNDAGSIARLALRVRSRRRVVLLAPNETDALAIEMLAASGVPLEAAQVTEPLAERLGPRLTELLLSAAPTSDSERELHSIRLRRAALPRYWEHASARRATAAPVSVLLASRRPEALLSAVGQVAQQDGVEPQLVVGLHGVGWSRDVETHIRELWRGPLVTIRLPEDVNLGDVLSELTRRSDGTLLVKWDDDDWYGRQHLSDLVLAYQYSGADIVGKAAEFIYLEQSDCTIRRFATGAEAFRWTISGGAMLTSRSWLTEIGGWPSLPAGVDRAMLERTRRAGGSAYRTHGFQYVVRRQWGPAHSHTWAVSDEHFLQAASEVRSGLDLGFGDVIAHP